MRGLAPLTREALARHREVLLHIEHTGNPALARLLSDLLTEAQHAHTAYEAAREAQREVRSLKNLVDGMQEHISYMVEENDSLRKLLAERPEAPVEVPF